MCVVRNAEYPWIPFYSLGLAISWLMCNLFPLVFFFLLESREGGSAERTLCGRWAQFRKAPASRVISRREQSGRLRWVSAPMPPSFHVALFISISRIFCRTLPRGCRGFPALCSRSASVEGLFSPPRGARVLHSFSRESRQIYLSFFAFDDAVVCVRTVCDPGLFQELMMARGVGINRRHRSHLDQLAGFGPASRDQGTV